MTKKLPNIINKLIPLSAIFLLLAIWQIVVMTGLVPHYMLPSPVEVVQAFINDFKLLMFHSLTSLKEAFLGLGFGILISLVAALFMDRFNFVYKALYPILVITQTIPTVAIAPLLILWLGYDIAPKIVLVIIVTFFPIAVSLLDGFKAADPDAINLLKAMGASKIQVYIHIKLPAAMPFFFSGLGIAISYSIVGAVISEWLGGFSGLGVYMTRVRKSYSFDKMFAVIFLISAISLLLMWLLKVLRRKLMPWSEQNSVKNNN